jgi:hypothetical protein
MCELSKSIVAFPRNAIRAGFVQSVFEKIREAPINKAFLSAACARPLTAKQQSAMRHATLSRSCAFIAIPRKKLMIQLDETRDQVYRTSSAFLLRSADLLARHANF